MCWICWYGFHPVHLARVTHTFLQSSTHSNLWPNTTILLVCIDWHKMKKPMFVWPQPHLIHQYVIAIFGIRGQLLDHCQSVATRLSSWTSHLASLGEGWGPTTNWLKHWLGRVCVEDLESGLLVECSNLDDELFQDLLNQLWAVYPHFFHLASTQYHSFTNECY